MLWTKVNRVYGRGCGRLSPAVFYSHDNSCTHCWWQLLGGHKKLIHSQTRTGLEPTNFRSTAQLTNQQKPHPDWWYCGCHRYAMEGLSWVQKMKIVSKMLQGFSFAYRHASLSWCEHQWCTTGDRCHKCQISLTDQGTGAGPAGALLSVCRCYGDSYCVSWWWETPVNTWLVDHNNLYYWRPLKKYRCPQTKIAVDLLSLYLARIRMHILSLSKQVLRIQWDSVIINLLK